MRWKPKHKQGDIRIIEKFLIWPIYLPVNYVNWPKEYRWWERVRIRQRYVESFISCNYWMDECFVEEIKSA